MSEPHISILYALEATYQLNTCNKNKRKKENNNNQKGAWKKKKTLEIEGIKQNKSQNQYQSHLCTNNNYKEN